MKKLIFIFAIPLAFFACKPFGMRYDNIPNERKPNLQNKDTVCFVNQQDNNLADTFSITRIDDYLLYDRNNSWERIVLSYINVNKQSDLRQMDVHIIGSNRCGVYDCVVSNNFETFDIDINNIKYPVFAVKNNNPQANSLPDSIYYSYKEGILRYFYSDTIYNRTSIF